MKIPKMMTKKMKKMKKTKLFLYISFCCFFIILFLLGIAVGKLIYDTDQKNSLNLLIKEINQKNKANFSCSCLSSSPRTITFTFNEEKVNEVYFWDLN